MKPQALRLTLSITFSILCTAIAAAAVKDIVIGTPHTQTVTLTDDNFDRLVTDPANGLWLLKFYAPWCGHCQKLAPVLHDIAAYLTGKMAIGKIDCTTEKKLCSKFRIEGYPTLKVYRDGDYFDYPGKRDADSLIIFGEKMSSYSVHMTSSYTEILDSILPKSEVGVVFVAYDANAQSQQHSPTTTTTTTTTTVESYIQSTPQLQIFGQVARKMQAYADFVLLHPSTPLSERRTHLGHHDDFFIAQVQLDAEPLLFYPNKNMTHLTTASLLEFVQTYNRPLITQLDVYNFRPISRKGKILAIAVVNPEEEETSTQIFLSQWKEYAKTGPEDIRNKYIFASIDGKKWSGFLQTFSIETNMLPQILLLDAPNRKYWFEKSMPMEEFMSGVDSGKVSVRIQTRSESKWLGRIEEWMWLHAPYSFLLAFVCLGGIIYLLTVSCFEDTEEYGRGKKQS